jgi:hypothetical protein
LGGLARFALPLLKQASIYLGKELLNQSTNVLSDVSQDLSFKEAVKVKALMDEFIKISVNHYFLQNRTKEGAQNIKKAAILKLRGGGGLRRMKASQLQSSSTRKQDKTKPKKLSSKSARISKKNLKFSSILN